MEQEQATGEQADSPVLTEWQERYARALSWWIFTYLPVHGGNEYTRTLASRIDSILAGKGDPGCNRSEPAGRIPPDEQPEATQ